MNIDNQHTLAPQILSDQILWIRRKRDINTTPMHLVKLVYLCHGWLLGIHGRSFIPELVEAWTYGPVVPSVYHAYKHFRSKDINTTPTDRSQEMDDAQRDVMEIVDEVYGDFSAIELSVLTHRQGTPWFVTRRTHGVGAIIPNELIRAHFLDMASGGMSE